jgi:FKBP-type peptidyl-prolyl cis-trans isomerase SlyD
VQIAKDSVVRFDYTLTGPDGKVLDSSQGKEPLAYLHGANNIIPGLESALAGKSAGENVKVTVPAAQAYGERNEQMVQQVPKSAFQGVPNIQPGMQFQARGPQGQQAIVTVTGVSGDTVTVDANHPLAGVPLNFDVSIVEVRAATAEELAHGHVHGAGGHHH